MTTTAPGLTSFPSDLHLIPMKERREWRALKGQIAARVAMLPREPYPFPVATFHIALFTLHEEHIYYPSRCSFFLLLVALLSLGGVKPTQHGSQATVAQEVLRVGW